MILYTSVSLEMYKQTHYSSVCLQTTAAFTHENKNTEKQVGL